MSEMGSSDRTAGRLMSIDTLRGADMSLIMGVQRLVIALSVWMGFGEYSWAADQMRHVVWHGWHVMDGVFPVFMFVSGLSWPFSHAKQRERGMTSGEIWAKIGKRVLTLFLLGLVCEGILRIDRGWDALRIGSVFFRIGICWAVAAGLSMYFGVKTRLAVAAVLLLGYWAITANIVAPDALTLAIPEHLDEFGRGPYSVVGNISGFIDRTILPGRYRYPGVLDTQGTLSTLPAICFPLFGTLAGEFVRLKKDGLTGTRKSLLMLATGLCFAGIGLLWSTVMPFNRSIWTSSHIMFSSGYALTLFSIFYWIVDVKGWCGWTFPLRVIGMNSLLIFLLQHMSGVNLMNVPAHAFFDGVANLFPKAAGDVVFAAGYVLTCWLLLWFLYRKNTFLKA